MNYMIHTCPKRLWYVEEYLIPSMKEQGCENISVYNDEKYEGSMKAHMNSFLQLPKDDGVTWHLQDDVIISKNFKEKTKEYGDGIVCAFSSEMYDGNKPAGVVTVDKKWFSFPCLCIPNKIAHECAEWILQYIIGNPVYKEFWQSGRNADWAFWFFIRNFYKDIIIFNLAPNLVDHIDYLIGGSANARSRENHCRSQYWQDEDLVQELERRLNNGKYRFTSY